jgi:TPR repeat protein
MTDLEVAKKACYHGNATMCYKVGLYHAKENGAKDDLARSYFEKACDNGQSQSCKHLGDLHRQ